MSTLTQQLAAVKAQVSTTVPNCASCVPWTTCGKCGVMFDQHCRCNCNCKAPEAVNWNSGVQWVVADPEGIDLAAQWGHEDATEGKRRGGDMFTFLSPEYHSYHAAYNAGLRLLNQLTGTVSRGALDECAWFEEIAGATPVAAGKAAAHVGGAGYARLSPEAKRACDAEQAAMRDEVHEFAEWIGLEQFDSRGAW